MLIIRKIGILVSIFFFAVFTEKGFAADPQLFAAPPLQSPVAAQEPADTAHWFDRYRFSFSPLAGILYGQAEEIVYRAADSDQFLSQLLWDLKPLVYVGFAVGFGPRDLFQGHGFMAAASFRFGLPFRSGDHENRDWLNPQANWLTHYSRHDVFIQNAILLDVSAGYSWRLANNLALRIFMEFSFMHFSWSGENGFVQYPDPVQNPGPNFPPWNNSFERIPVYGMVIRYSQNWFIFAPGFSLTWRIHERFSLGGNFSYTPLIFCRARDDHLHYSNQRTFWDFLSSGHYFNGGGSFVFSPRNNLDISLSVSYRYITGTRGRTYIQDNMHGTRTGRHHNIAGAGFSALNVGLAATMHFGQN